MKGLPILRWTWPALLATAAAAQTEPPLTYRAIREMPPAAVALRLLGSGQGADVVRIESRREPMLPGALDIMLFHRPVPVGRDYCSQSVHQVTLFTVRHEGTQTVLDNDGLRVQNTNEWDSLARAGLPIERRAALCRHRHRGFRYGHAGAGRSCRRASPCGRAWEAADPAEVSR